MALTHTKQRLADLRSRLASTPLSSDSMAALSREHLSIGMRPMKRLRAKQGLLVGRDVEHEATAAWWLLSAAQQGVDQWQAGTSA